MNQSATIMGNQQRMQIFMGVITQWQQKQLQKITELQHQQSQYQRNCIINNGKQQITDKFKKQIKQLETDIKINRGKIINEYRLRKMKVKYQMIENITQLISARILGCLCSTQKYQELLVGLIIQASIKMLEPKIIVKCIERDEGITRIAIIKSSTQYTSITGLSCEFILSSEYLSEQQLGGVILTNFDGKIVCSNTLKARLSHTIQQCLPEITTILFN